VNLGGIVAPAGFDAATNRTVPNGGASGWNYDLAGDIDRDAANVTYTFDAEGRMAAACLTVQCRATRCGARSGRRGKGVLQ
jgi:YD repeat-containing protein